jgi:HAD superfamily phosphoserine phosphatase-like hydrolase
MTLERNLTEVLLFLASPSDVEREAGMVEEIVTELNRTVAAEKGIALRLVRWTNDAHPGFGGDGQAIVNRQIAEMARYSLFICVMWNRVGSPTPRAVSGTVEEYQRAAAAFKDRGRPDIWLYFRDAPASLDTEEALSQRKAVVAFKKQVQRKALYWVYGSHSDFSKKVRRQLIQWIGKLTPTSSLPRRPGRRPARPRTGRLAIMVRVNGYKLFYYRLNRKLTFTALSRVSRVKRGLLRQLERIRSHKGSIDMTWFASCDRGTLEALERVLECPGRLEAGKADDFLTQYMLFYEIYKGTKPSRVRAMDWLPLQFKTAAVVFDFDGTLTLPGEMTTWEKLWVALGYRVSDCAELHRRFRLKEFSHDEWCAKTLAHFKSRGMTQAHLDRVVGETTLVQDVADTVRQLRAKGMRLYILSGSIKSLIRKVLGDLFVEFDDVRANELVFDSAGKIQQIVGTPYDFEGKALFLKRMCTDLAVRPSDILFVGNSCNDIFASLSGVRTLCVNARHTDPDNPEQWTYAVREMKSLQEILKYATL